MERRSVETTNTGRQPSLGGSIARQISLGGSIGRKMSLEPHIVPIEQEALEDVKPVKLTWRSWIVILSCCIA